MSAAKAPKDDDLPPDEAKVFLSYSRKDRERAQGIADALRDRHFGVFKDTDDILPTEEWRERLQQLIEEADTIVFLMSPHSIVSEVCAWEVEYATALNKRIAPIVIEEVEGQQIPPLLARLNFIFCTPRDPFQNAVDTLVSALNTDVDWIREHTRLAGLARRWRNAGAPKRLLLRGQDIADAERWRDSHPKDAPDITDAHLALIGESRRAAQTRQRIWIAGSMAATVITAGLAVFAYLQSIEADRQRVEAEVQRAAAEEQRGIAEDERDRAEDERRRAEEQRDLAEQRLREALIERTRRNLSDSAAMLSDGRPDAAAPLTLDALRTAKSLGDETLRKESVAAARQLLFRDRSLGYLETHHGEAYGWPRMDISPDGLFASSLQSDTLSVWSLRTGLRTIRSDGVKAIGWRADGNAVIVRSAVGAPEAELLVIDPENAQPVTRAAIAPSVRGAWVFGAQKLALATVRDGDAYQLIGLDTDSGEIRFRTRHATAPDDLAVSTDGERIAFILEDGARVVILDRRGNEIASRPAEDAAAPVFAPDSHDLAFRAEPGWKLWRADGEPETVFSGDEPADHFQFLPDGRHVARSGLQSVTLTGADGGAISVAATPAFGISGAGVEHGTVVVRLDQQFTVHDASNGALLHRLGRVAPPIGGSHLSRDGRYLAAVHQDGFVSVWSTETGRETLAIRPEGGAQWIHVLDRPGGSILVALDGRDRLGIWRIEPHDLVFANQLVSIQPPVEGKVAIGGSFLEPARIWDIGSASPVRNLGQSVVMSSDAASGRMMISMPGSGLAILRTGQQDPVRLQGERISSAWETVWSLNERIAIHGPGTVAVFDTGTGERLAELPMGDAESGPVVRAMGFAGPDRLAILGKDRSLVIADPSGQAPVRTIELPAEARDLVPSPDGGSLLVADGNKVWRLSLTDGDLVPIEPDAEVVRIGASGRHTAEIRAFLANDSRRAWLMDLNSGAKRFELDWHDALVLGGLDRLIASESAQGVVTVRDARTGATRFQIEGDGGKGGFPSRPLLSDDETRLMAVNGGADMLRLIDTGTGDVLAAVERIDGFAGLFAPGSDFSAVAMNTGTWAAITDFAPVLLQEDVLARQIAQRFPAVQVPDPGIEFDRCDALASFGHDPRARTDGVAYEQITWEAQEACDATAREKPDDPTTLFQQARVATLYAPQNDVQSVKRLTELADGGYAAASYTLAFLMLQGRAPGDIETVERRLREAASGGAGVAHILLARLAELGHIEGDPTAIIDDGLKAGRPAVIEQRLRTLLSGTPGGPEFRKAVELAFRAADAWRERRQFNNAGWLEAAAAGFARRYRPSN